MLYYLFDLSFFEIQNLINIDQKAGFFDALSGRLPSGFFKWGSYAQIIFYRTDLFFDSFGGRTDSRTLLARLQKDKSEEKVAILIKNPWINLFNFYTKDSRWTKSWATGWMD